jgi:hypothetical protein
MQRSLQLLTLALASCASTEEVAPAFGAGWELVYSQDFSEGSSLEDFSYSDRRAWRWSPGTTGVPDSLELSSESFYRPRHRSPYAIALLHGRVFQSFILEADLYQTGEEYGHRDLCLFFGFQDPEHFHYVHLASKPDDHAHNIFLVDDAPRVKTAPVATRGVDWDTKQWHKVRLERDVKSGETRVYFDDMSSPILAAKNDTLNWGLLGFGSFDDTGRFAGLKVWAPEKIAALPNASEPFSRPDKLQFP